MELHNFLPGLSLSLDGKIYTNDLSAILDNMGVKISNKDLKALTKNFPADGEQVFRYHRCMPRELKYKNHRQRSKGKGH